MINHYKLKLGTNKALPSKASPRQVPTHDIFTGSSRHWSPIHRSPSGGAHIWIRHLKIRKFFLKLRLTENNESEFVCPISSS